MIDFSSITLASLGEFFKDFPSRFIFTGDAFRSYVIDTPTPETPLRFYFKTPTDKSMFLYYRTLNCKKDSVLYRVLQGGSASGGTAVPVFNMNKHFSQKNPSGCTFNSGVAFSGTMVEVDAEPIYGSVEHGHVSTGGLTQDNNYRVFIPNEEFFLEISTSSIEIGGEVKLELQWVEL